MERETIYTDNLESYNSNEGIDSLIGLKSREGCANNEPESRAIPHKII